MENGNNVLSFPISVDKYLWHKSFSDGDIMIKIQ